MSKMIHIRYIRTPILVFLVLISGLLIMGYSFHLSDINEMKSLTSITGTQIALRLDEQIQTHINTIEHIRDELKVIDHINQEFFEEYVAKFLNQQKGFQAINFIDPAGVIIWIVPEKGNEMVLGRDLHDHAYANTTFSLAEKSHTDQITPPLTLWQGGVGFATYFPVIYSETLKGYVNGVVRITDFLDSYLYESSLKQFHIQIHYQNTVIYEANVPTNQPAYELSSDHLIDIGNNAITISLMPNPSLFTSETRWLRIMFYFIGFSFSVAFTILSYFNLKRQYNLTETSNRIKASEEKYRRIFENSNDAIYQTSTDGSLLMANAAWFELFKYDPTDLKTFNVIDLYFNSDDRTQFVNSIMEDGSVNNYDIILKKKSGEKVYCLLSSTVMVDENGNGIGYQGIVHDITEKMKHERELSRALKETEKSIQLKNNIIKNMSHEIRTPLNSILGFVDILEDEFKHQLTGETQNHFTIIQHSGKRLARTISEILDYSTVESGSYAPDLSRLNIIQLLNGIIDSLAYLCEENHVSIEFGWQGKQCWALIDEYGFTHAMNNIIHNAIQYSKGGVITLTIDETEDCLTLSVKDNGIGISSEFQQDMFNVFSQESVGTGRHYEGLGLGLPLAKLFLELINGQLNIKSEKDKGTTVIVSLPKISEKAP